MMSAEYVYRLFIWQNIIIYIEFVEGLLPGLILKGGGRITHNYWKFAAPLRHHFVTTRKLAAPMR